MELRPASRRRQLTGRIAASIADGPSAGGLVKTSENGITAGGSGQFTAPYTRGSPFPVVRLFLRSSIILGEAAVADHPGCYPTEMPAGFANQRREGRFYPNTGPPEAPACVLCCEIPLRLIRLF